MAPNLSLNEFPPKLLSLCTPITQCTSEVSANKCPETHKLGLHKQGSTVACPSDLQVASLVAPPEDYKNQPCVLR